MTTIPKIVFIVPYRNRIHHKFFFCKYMSFLLENKSTDEYEIYFSHQHDKRSFNRGAMKNIGFLAMKDKYPNDYKNMSFVFNDVDTIPFNKIFDYKTTQGIIRHYYGFRFALGGIVVVNGGDFEKMNGYPCYWGWGMEDNILQKRALRSGIQIDRSNFYAIGSPEILQLFDGFDRIISKDDPRSMNEKNNVNGLSTMSQIQYTFSNKSSETKDNIFILHDNFKINFINATYFQTYIPYYDNSLHEYDVRDHPSKMKAPTLINATKKVEVDNDPQKWKDIQHNPLHKMMRKSKQENEVNVADDAIANHLTISSNYSSNSTVAIKHSSNFVLHPHRGRRNRFNR